jgi:tRNA modification GTPase
MRIAIVGPPNVGKSTLLNRFLRDDRALVSEVAGTTRDVVQGDMDLGGIPVSFADTAGLRETQDPLERQGIARTLITVNRADTVLFVCDQIVFPESLVADVKTQMSPGAKLLKVINKADLLSASNLSKLAQAEQEVIAISALTGAGVDKLEATLRAHLGFTEVEEGEFVARARHLQGLTRALEALFAAKARLQEKPFAVEIFAEELRLAQHALESLVGKVDAESLLDSIFSQFCLGK